jgi:hypothetical protein
MQAPKKYGREQNEVRRSLAHGTGECAENREACPPVEVVDAPQWKAAGKYNTENEADSQRRCIGPINRLEEASRKPQLAREVAGPEYGKEKKSLRKTEWRVEGLPRGGECENPVGCKAYESG